MLVKLESECWIKTCVVSFELLYLNKINPEKSLRDYDDINLKILQKKNT